MAKSTSISSRRNSTRSLLPISRSKRTSKWDYSEQSADFKLINTKDGAQGKIQTYGFSLGTLALKMTIIIDKAGLVAGLSVTMREWLVRAESEVGCTALDMKKPAIRQRAFSICQISVACALEVLQYPIQERQSMWAPAPPEGFQKVHGSRHRFQP